MQVRKACFCSLFAVVLILVAVLFITSKLLLNYSNGKMNQDKIVQPFHVEPMHLEFGLPGIRASRNPGFRQFKNYDWSDKGLCVYHQEDGRLKCAKITKSRSALILRLRREVKEKNEIRDSTLLQVLKDKSSRVAGRQRRGIWELRDMVKSVTGISGEAFLGYGNWCGLGGSGTPLDPIDECCENHDICYNASKKTVCRDHEDKAVYKVDYRWRVADDETAICEDEKDMCKMTVCLCDAVLTNCLKSNLQFYDENKRREETLAQILKDAEFLYS